MDEILAVEKGKHLHNRVEHFAGFLGGERTLAKNLGKNLVGIFSDDIEQIFTGQPASSGIKDTHQVGMGKASGQLPLSDAGFRIHLIRPAQLDGGFPWGIAFQFR